MGSERGCLSSMVFPKLAGARGRGRRQGAHQPPAASQRERLASANNPGFALLWVRKVNIYSIPLLLYPQPYNIN